LYEETDIKELVLKSCYQISYCK